MIGDESPAAVEATTSSEDDRPVATPNRIFLAGVLIVAIRALVIGTGIWSVAANHQPPTRTASGLPWIAWDARHYVQIVKVGYSVSRSDPDFPLIAYFPLVPAVAKVMTLAFSPPLALVVLANACSIAGFGVFFCWVRNLTKDRRIAFVAMFFVAMWPGAVFLSAGMTEGPFFLLVATSLYFLQKRRFWIAAIVCALATFARPTGVALAATLSLSVLLQDSPASPWRRLALATLIGIVASSGAIAYESFLLHRFGELNAYTQAQHAWKLADQELPWSVNSALNRPVIRCSSFSPSRQHRKPGIG